MPLEVTANADRRVRIPPSPQLPLTRELSYTLDHLHILLNYAWDCRSLLSLILIGLSDLNDRLIMRRNRSLLTQLTYRLSVEPLSPDDTAEYIRARLTAAGAAEEIFTSDAIAIPHEAASGTWSRAGVGWDRS